MSDKIRKYVLPNLPYLFVFWFFSKIGTAYRIAPGTDFGTKLMGMLDTFPKAFETYWPGLGGIDLLVGLAGAAGMYLLIQSKIRQAKKFRRDAEYGTARFGTKEDIKPFVDPKFQNNVILTGTEFLTMNTRPKIPANARNLNACVIGSSGSGKTRFWLTPQLLQAHSSYVVVDPKGGTLDQCGRFLQRVLALQNGEVDVCANFLSASSISQLQSNSNYQIESVGSLGYTLITFSQSNELLQDVNVRKALAASCDREALVNVAMSGAATPMYTPISPVYSDFTASNIRQPEFDTAAAASILENAGYVDTNGDGIRESADGKPLSFTITYKGTMANVDGVMSILSSDFAKAGVELKLQPVDAATFSANVTQGHKYDISYSSWGTIDDVDTTLLTIFGIGQTLNFMEFNSQEQEDLLNAMQSETDYSKRLELLNEWQTWFVENLPCCHLFVPNNTYAADTTNFTGWHLSPGNSAFLACANFVNVHAK